MVTPQEFSVPSPLIDAALLDLLSTVSQLSDDSFDYYWLNLTAREVELLVVALIRDLASNLKGEYLKSLLERIRHDTPD